MGALDGVKVLDISRVVAGPYCGQLLADNGATVIKVESPDGDLNRAFPLVLGPGMSTNNLMANRGKRGISLNLKSPKARDILYRLVAEVDVVIQSFLPSTAASLGVDWETFSRINPDLIYASVSGYGAKGPLRDKPGYDTMLTAHTGIMSLTGEPDRPPSKPGVIVIDMGTAMLTFGSIMSALFARAAGKARGQKVETSLLETGVSLLGFHGLAYTVGGVVDRREGAGYTTLAPYDAYACADGDILIGAPNQAKWLALCDALDAKALADDPRYADNTARCAHRPELRADLERILTGATVATWLERLEAKGVPSAPINTVDRVFADPQVLANDMLVTSRDAAGNELKLLGLPFKLSATPGAPGAAPPGIGEHNVEVLGEMLGYTPAEVAALKAEGVL